jgi:formate/nitrite transporter FocA (FNT family)
METTTLIDLLTKFLPLIILIISAFIIYPFKHLIKNLWRRKAAESDILKDYEQKIEKLDNEFMSFVKDDIKERYFFIRLE